MSMISASVSSVPFSLPPWATPGENRRKFGKAKALGADHDTLADEDLTDGFLEAKSVPGDGNSPII